jgi:hypothetical protein
MALQSFHMALPSQRMCRFVTNTLLPERQESSQYWSTCQSCPLSHSQSSTGAAARVLSSFQKKNVVAIVRDNVFEVSGPCFQSFEVSGPRFQSITFFLLEAVMTVQFIHVTIEVVP